MKEKHDFTVPDYFTEFSCKMGDCRQACCCGWSVSVSMQNYYSLIGVDCSKALRRKLDCAMHMVDSPTDEKYASLNQRYDGDCILRAEDGKCSLQCELGEDALPDICRLYPRGIRFDGEAYECSMSNSCEATLELLFDSQRPIAFENKKLCFGIPKSIERSHHFEAFDRERELRMFFIKIMQDRKHTIPVRLMRLSSVFQALDIAAHNKDNKTAEKILCQDKQYELPALSLNTEECLTHGIEIMEMLIKVLSEHSRSIHEYAGEILENFTSSDRPFEVYNRMKLHFETLFPTWQNFFENMLVNHMYFDLFPFQDRPVPPIEEFAALAAVYAILRFLSLGWIQKHPSKEALIDICAAAFRFIEHTEFDRYAARLLKNTGCDTEEKLYALICL